MDRGVLPVLYAATSPEAHGGRLYGPDGLGQFTGAPTELKIYPSARQPADQKRLWDVLEKLSGTTSGEWQRGDPIR
ncbi:hypothetical protein [Winogradskya humida]|uniref:RES domain-containing protein n=1 Tax=Winogradskya humida TaxID=113566 RepID=A0ABQ4A2M9_9ACTN|nr:hypothetical protein [Actinoplanes humidus]GIE25099.1 hypothetical protein Ahu01nite_082010 [Actinoplanes humidus]